MVVIVGECDGSDSGGGVMAVIVWEGMMVVIVGRCDGSDSGGGVMVVIVGEVRWW